MLEKFDCMMDEKVSILIEEKLDARINEIRTALGKDQNKGMKSSRKVVNQNNVKPISTNGYKRTSKVFEKEESLP